MAKNKKFSVKKCKKCGRRLNSYNKTGECHFHRAPSDAKGVYGDHIGPGNYWSSREGHSQTDN